MRSLTANYCCAYYFYRSEKDGKRKRRRKRRPSSSSGDETDSDERKPGNGRADVAIPEELSRQPERGDYLNIMFGLFVSCAIMIVVEVNSPVIGYKLLCRC